MDHAQKKKTSKPSSPVARQCLENAGEGEFHEGAVRLAVEHCDDCQSEAAALTAIAGKLDCSPDRLRTWVRQTRRDGGERRGPGSAEIARTEPLRRHSLPGSGLQANRERGVKPNGEGEPPPQADVCGPEHAG